MACFFEERQIIAGHICNSGITERVYITNNYNMNYRPGFEPGTQGIISTWIWDRALDRSATTAGLFFIYKNTTFLQMLEKLFFHFQKIILIFLVNVRTLSVTFPLHLTDIEIQYYSILLRTTKSLSNIWILWWNLELRKLTHVIAKILDFEEKKKI